MLRVWSTSNEGTPEYFGTKGALSLKNENIMYGISIHSFFPTAAV